MSQNLDSAATEGSVTARRDGEVLRLTLNRPDQRNALSHAMIESFIDALTDAVVDDSLRAVHIAGAGSDFCAGADWVAANSGTGERPRAGALVRRTPYLAHRLIELVHTIQLPVVCSVQGWAVGLGCNLALAADFTVASADATFWEPFVTRGFTPDSGASWLLPRLIGLTRAKEMLLLGEKVSSTEAAEWGLIHRAVDRRELDSASEHLLTRLAGGPTVAIGLAKQAIHYAAQATLTEAMTQELFSLELSCRTVDFKEGLAAFQERRTPKFRGR
ncbi:enoyl-CoA hydratase/isomerase family protein [Mycobacterium noviomagense]|uniref:Enoyl-CoA hydratase n=1 Tax=Mycobacterium noviomagense TaxID=459858 RepID=A0A7I7P8F5_9MYCO|nr:enoyl-CoA hydratase-related protein [Mycobacterium noviomagense]ORB18634.1 enoyl-CoA hydratase [Mycobacterium noviomagense]BBY04984.1 enoyl-CoA hydratase [Mycobacterium noviomagense]